MGDGTKVVRSVERAFWRGVRDGLSVFEAAQAVGISFATGYRKVRQCGGVMPADLGEPSGRYLSLTEREELALLRAEGRGVREIARVLGRSASTISRELVRGTTAGRYRAIAAQVRADERATRPKARKLAANPRLASWVQDKLAPPAGGRWARAWSPTQVSRRLRVEFPDDDQMRISHEAIYQALYVQGRGGLRRELATALRTGRAMRRPQRSTSNRGKRSIPAHLMISERPAEIEDRAVPGHWEGDLIIGANSKSAIGTLVERTTRYVMLLHLPNGHHAEAVRDAMLTQIRTLPAHLRKSLTWDQGSEMTPFAQIKIADDLDLYFCDPHSPWQRGTNENTNGLLRQYFPKGTDLSIHTADDLEEVALLLNDRPRQTLDWAKPAEALNRLLLAA
ncbi:IS30 family transposase [Isoptericola sp. QY 916]|jgi:IS30 family transposase|uniref:IS30 family transposase n=1 Tax=Isoptericola sp. QY 916 TaxID=2782570 RepID=UPI003D2FAC3F